MAAKDQKGQHFEIGERVNVSIRSANFTQDTWRTGTVKSLNKSGANVKLDGSGEAFFYFERIRHVAKTGVKPWKNPAPIATLGEVAGAKTGTVVPLRHFEPRQEQLPLPPVPKEEDKARPRAAPTRPGNLLDPALRSFLVAKVKVRGKATAAQDLQELDPHGNGSHHTIGALIGKPDHRWSVRNHTLLVALAESYGYVEPPPPPTISVSQHVESVEEADSGIDDAVSRALRVAIRAAVEAGRWVEVHELSKELRTRSHAESGEGIGHRTKQFPDLPPVMQRQIIENMHRGFADKLRDGGVKDGALSSVWRTSYQAFERATGKALCRRASAESDAGTRVSPLDIVEREGELVRFWEIVRRTWEGV